MSRIERLYSLAVQFISLDWSNKYVIGVNLGVADEMDYYMDNETLENIIFREVVRGNKTRELQKEIDYFWDIPGGD